MTRSRITTGQVVVAAVGALVLAGLFFAVTRPRTFVVYTIGTGPVEGQVLETPVRCGSILGADGVQGWEAATVVDPVPEYLPIVDSIADPSNCPEEGVTWLAVVGIVAMLIVGFTAWGFGYLGRADET